MSHHSAHEHLRRHSDDVRSRLRHPRDLPDGLRVGLHDDRLTAKRLRVTPTILRAAALRCDALPTLFRAGSDGAGALFALLDTTPEALAVVRFAASVAESALRRAHAGRHPDSRALDAVVRTVARAASRATPSGLAASVGRFTIERGEPSAGIGAMRRYVRVRSRGKTKAEFLREFGGAVIADRVAVAVNPSLRLVGRRWYVIDGIAAAAPSQATVGRWSVADGPALRAIRDACGDRGATVRELIEALSANGATSDAARTAIAALLRNGVLLGDLRPSFLGDLDSVVQRAAALGAPVDGTAYRALSREHALARDIDGTSFDDVVRRFANAADAERVTREDVHADLFHESLAVRVGEDHLAAVRTYGELVMRSARRRQSRRLRRLFMDRYEGPERRVPLLDFVSTAYDELGRVPDEPAAAEPSEARRLVHDLLTRAERERSCEAVLTATELRTLFGAGEGAGDDAVFEFAVRLGRIGGRAVVFPSTLSTTDAPGRAGGRFAYGLGGDAARYEEVELVSEPVGTPYWSFVDRRIDPAVRIVQNPHHRSGRSYTLAELHVGMTAAGALALFSGDGTRLGHVRERHLASPSYRSFAITVVENVANDGASIPYRLIDWGPLADAPFLPRVRYQGAVLSLARWALDVRGRDDEALCAELERRRIPRFVHAGLQDRLFAVDTTTVAGLRLMREEGRRRGGIVTLTEFPEYEAATDTFTVERVAELLFEVRRDRAPVGQIDARGSAPAVVRAPGGDEWMYAKLYLAQYAADDFLTAELPGLVAAYGDAPFFFVRYFDLGPHVRLRIARRTPERDAEFMALVDGLRERGAIDRWARTVYEPELDRYGGVEGVRMAESVFAYDSARCLDVLRVSGREEDMAIVSARSFLETFGDAIDDDVAFRDAERVGLTTQARAFVRTARDAELPRHREVCDALGVDPRWFARSFRSLFHMHCNRLGVQGEPERSATAILRAAYRARATR
jgi:lantibiotic biosynthesis protein